VWRDDALGSLVQGAQNEARLTLAGTNEHRNAVHLRQGDFAGLPDAVRRAREVGKVWVEALVGLKREAEQEARSLAA